jgi:hypothetical protein
MQKEISDKQQELSLFAYAADKSKFAFHEYASCLHYNRYFLIFMYLLK